MKTCRLHINPELISEPPGNTKEVTQQLLSNNPTKSSIETEFYKLRFEPWFKTMLLCFPPLEGQGKQEMTVGL